MSAAADAVSVLRVRGGKLVYARDYFFAPEVEERVWGRSPEIAAA